MEDDSKMEAPEFLGATASKMIKKDTLEHMSSFIVGAIATLVFVLFSMISGCWASFSWTSIAISVSTVYVASTATCWYMRKT